MLEVATFVTQEWIISLPPYTLLPASSTDVPPHIASSRRYLQSEDAAANVDPEVREALHKLRNAVIPAVASATPASTPPWSFGESVAHSNMDGGAGGAGDDRDDEQADHGSWELASAVVEALTQQHAGLVEVGKIGR